MLFLLVFSLFLLKWLETGIFLCDCVISQCMQAFFFMKTELTVTVLIFFEDHLSSSLIFLVNLFIHLFFLFVFVFFFFFGFCLFVFVKDGWKQGLLRYYGFYIPFLLFFEERIMVKNKRNTVHLTLVFCIWCFFYVIFFYVHEFGGFRVVECNSLV